MTEGVRQLCPWWHMPFPLFLGTPSPNTPLPKPAATCSHHSWAGDPDPGQGALLWGRRREMGARGGCSGLEGGAYRSRSTAAWGSGPSEPRWWRRLCPPVPTWHCWGDLGTGREGVSWASLASGPSPSCGCCQKLSRHRCKGRGSGNTPCPVRDRAQPFSKGKLPPYTPHASAPLRNPRKLQGSWESSREPAWGRSRRRADVPDAPNGRCPARCPRAASVLPAAGTGEAAGPYPGRRSRFSAAALAA